MYTTAPQSTLKRLVGLMCFDNDQGPPLNQEAKCCLALYSCQSVASCICYNYKAPNYTVRIHLFIMWLCVFCILPFPPFHFAECTFRQFMQKAIQLPSPVSSPRQTPPPAVTSSPGIPIPVSSSPHHQQQQQHSQLQNYSSTTHAMASYATVSSSPSKKKGPPSPLSLGGQSPPPPSFSSVAAGQSPKPTSPLLKLKQVTSPVKGQVAGGTMGAAMNSVNNLPSSLSPSSSTTSVHTVPNTAMMYAASDRGLMAGRQDVVSRPGRLADITGPATSLEHLGFSFIIGPSVTSSDISIATVSSASHIYLGESNLLPQQTFTVNNVGPWQAGVCLSSVKGGGGVGSGINTLAGGNSPLVAVASVSSRRNYRVASTSSDGAGSNINGGDFGQFNVSSKSRNSAAGAGEVGINYGIGVELSTVSSITSPSSSPALPHILEATMRSESVSLKGLSKIFLENKQYSTFHQPPPPHTPHPTTHSYTLQERAIP